MEQAVSKRKCYYWKQWKYYVDIGQITIKEWIAWCTELYYIQHHKHRPKDHRIYIDPRMEKAVVKARFWYKDQIEKWLNEHGYVWTMTVETKYQFPFEDESEVELIDADAMAKEKRA